jgi:Phosphotransferase enzyme family
MLPKTEATGLGIERRYGPFGPAAVKPYSRTQRSLDGGSLLKIYLGIDPRGRRRREAEALVIAGHSGLSVPAVLATGDGEGCSWTLFRILPGNPCTTGTKDGIRHYLAHVLAVADRLHRSAAGLRPGPGWTADEQEVPVTQRQFLLEQLTARCRQKPWWPELEEALEPINASPTVYLHGDLKPEHLLVDSERLHVVDWEASCRGPAAGDFADIVFHLVRDLIYAVPPSDLPTSLIADIPLHGPVLAWRLIRWLDRRRPTDIGLLTVGDFYRLATEDQPTRICGHLAHTVARLRRAGVPR